MQDFSKRSGLHRRRSKHATIITVAAAVLGASTAVWAAVPDVAPVPEPRQGTEGRTTAATSPTTPAVAQVRPPPEPKPPAPLIYPAVGDGTWRTAAGQPPPAGKSGSLQRYRVLVEESIERLEIDEFANTVSDTLDDHRGWTASGKWRMQRVGPGQPYDFTIYLATPETRDTLCGVAQDGYTSCRNGDAVVINVARWVKGVPDYGASLETYRQYVINHEVGHRLGHGHELCPGDEQPAPVMQQQSLGLHRCKANPWPYLDGERHAGPSGEYDDPAPPPDRGSANPASKKPT